MNLKYKRKYIMCNVTPVECCEVSSKLFDIELAEKLNLLCQAILQKECNKESFQEELDERRLAIEMDEYDYGQ